MRGGSMSSSPERSARSPLELAGPNALAPPSELLVSPSRSSIILRAHEMSTTESSAPLLASSLSGASSGSRGGGVVSRSTGSGVDGPLLVLRELVFLSIHPLRALPFWLMDSFLDSIPPNGTLGEAGGDATGSLGDGSLGETDPGENRSFPPTKNEGDAGEDPPERFPADDPSGSRERPWCGCGC